MIRPHRTPGTTFRLGRSEPARVASTGRSRRGPWRPALALVAAALLAACGDDTSDAPAAAAPPPTAVGGVTQLAPPDPAWLASTSPVVTLTKAQLDDATAQRGWTALAGPARCDVTVHAMLHPTVGPRGEPTDASGAVLVPGGEGCAGPYPIVSYSRGTDLDRDFTMTDAQDREVQAIAGFFAARGYVVVASDYLGYARSAFPYHPYLHAESVGRTTIDALRAGRALLARLAVAESGRVFLAGISQGGHAVLATQRAIERDRPAGVRVTAAGAMSGPYDLAGSFPEVASIAPLLALDFNGSRTGQQAVLRLGDSLGTSASELLQNATRLRETLRDNSVLGWTPQAPMLLCGGARDPIVPFSNTVRAAADFASRGVRVPVVDVDQVPDYAPLLPPPGTSARDLGSYHQGTVPPLCFAQVRDRLFEPAR